MANIDRSINYIEFPLVDADRTWEFYTTVFGWKFEKWHGNYISFTGAGIEGGFNGTSASGLKVTEPGILVLLYAEDLEGTQKAIEDEGCEITRQPYDFPGGRRFHFKDPNGIELVVWKKVAK